MNKKQLLDRILTLLFYTLIIMSLFAFLMALLPLLVPFLIGCGAISGILGNAFPLEKVLWKESPEFDTKITAKDIFYSIYFGIFLMILFVIIVLPLHNFMSGTEGAILILLFYGVVSFGVFFKVPQRAGVMIRGLFLRGGSQ